MAVKIYEFEYSSGIGEHIASFVKQKRAADYPYNESARILRYFDQMIAKEFPEAETITKCIVDSWISHQSDVHQNTLLRRMTIRNIKSSSWALPKKNKEVIAL